MVRSRRGLKMPASSCAAMQLELVRVSTQRADLGDPAILGVVDDRKRLLLGVVEGVKGGA